MSYTSFSLIALWSCKRSFYYTPVIINGFKGKLSPEKIFQNIPYKGFILT